MFGIPPILTVRDPLLQARAYVASRAWLRLGIFVFAVVLFFTGAAISFLNLSELPELNAWPLLLLATVGVPANILLGARRFQVSADVINAHYSFRASVGITLTSMAANILPLPGGVAIRLLALKRNSSTYSQAAGVTGVTALLWLATAAVVAAVALWLLNAGNMLTVLFLVAGVFCTVTSLIWLVAMGARYSQLGELVAVQFAMVLLDAARLWLAALGLGFSIAFERIAVLTMSSVASAAVGFAPGGLGVRELAAAGLAPLVDVSPAVAFLVTGVDRLIGLVLIGFAVFIAWKYSPFGYEREREIDS